MPDSHFWIQAVDPTQTVMMPATGLLTAYQVATVILAITVLVIAIGLLFAVRHVVALARAARELMARLEPGMHPVLERSRATLENMEHITRSVRDDAERIESSVKALTGRLQQASDHMEARIDEFNALMEVVQSEAEEIFIGTAATVRGVKKGARQLAAGDDRRAFEGNAPTAREASAARDLSAPEARDASAPKARDSSAPIAGEPRTQEFGARQPNDSPEES